MPLKNSEREPVGTVKRELLEADMLYPVLRLETEIEAWKKVQKEFLILADNALRTNTDHSDVKVEYEHDELDLRILNTENVISSLQ